MTKTIKKEIEYDIPEIGEIKCFLGNPRDPYVVVGLSSSHRFPYDLPTHANTVEVNGIYSKSITSGLNHLTVSAVLKAKVLGKIDIGDIIDPQEIAQKAYDEVIKTYIEGNGIKNLDEPAVV